MNVVILGFGISGRSAAAFLLREGHTVFCIDRNAEALRSHPEAAVLLRQGLNLIGEEEETPRADLVVLSPGIPPAHPLLKRYGGVEVIGEIELAFRHVKNRCVGVTGTNGKTTTVQLISHVLNTAGIQARSVGNVGVGLCGCLLCADPNEVFIVELSSFQLETLKQKRLECALLLNIQPDHLDRYSSFADYANAKLSIQNCIKEGGAFYTSKQVAKDYGVSAAIFDETALDFGSDLPGRDLQLAAFAVCKDFGVSKEKFEEGLKTFKMPEHRLEFVANVRGISFYNDSKATNIDSVIYAAQRLKGPIILLVGGVDKGASYAPWIHSFYGKVKKIIAFGESSNKIKKELKDVFEVHCVETLGESVIYAIQEAHKDDTILLSPGCSSFDQFQNFEHRGREFKRIVLEIYRS